MTKISGCVCIRDGFKMDYPFEESIKSLLPVCDEVVVCDAGSRDGTLDALHCLSKTDNRVRLVSMDWNDPVADYFWHVKWLNYARQQLRFPIQLHLDADELLDEGSYAAIREKAELPDGCHWFRRHTFFHDAKTQVKPGYLCGHLVVRMAPTNMEMVSDQPYPDGPEPAIRLAAGWPPDAHADPRLKILHYGFLRDPDCLAIKSLAMDSRYGVQRVNHPGDGIEPYEGSHPALIHEWLTWRGHHV